MTDEEKLEKANCPTCGQPVYIHTGDEGTGCYLPRPAQVEDDWEKEFDKEFGTSRNYSGIKSHINIYDIKQFIRNLLAKREGKEISKLNEGNGEGEKCTNTGRQKMER